jgi:hypothetical protein
MKPTHEERMEHLRVGVVDDTCLVCGVEFGGVHTDSSHQIRCIQCGVTYQVEGSKHPDEWLAQHGLKREEVAKHTSDCYVFLPIFRDYWDETGRKIPIGFYMGDPGYTQEEFVLFYKWLFNNKDRYYEEYKFDLQWARIEALATVDQLPETEDRLKIAKKYYKEHSGQELTDEQAQQLFGILPPEEKKEDTM